MYLILDIETIPNQSIQSPEMPDDFVKYGNTKDESKREIIRQEAIEQWNSGLTKKMSLSGDLCQIISCGFIIANPDLSIVDGGVLFDENGDSEIIDQIICKMEGKKIVGWASKHFDIHVIWKRAIMQGINYPIELYQEQIKKYDTKHHIDLMQIWNNFEYGKMADCAKALGIECKTGLDGSMIYDAYKEKRYEEIVAYNYEDCTTCLEIMRRIGYGKNKQNNNAF